MGAAPTPGPSRDEPPATADELGTAPPDDREEARRPARRRAVLVTLLVMIVAAGTVGALAASGRLPGIATGAAAEVPAAGEIWFGDKSDPSTFVLGHRWTSTIAGRPIAAVAHLTRPIAAGEASLRIDADGARIADQPLDSLTSAGNLIGFGFTPPFAGTYTFTIVDAGGATLATGTIAAS